MDDYLAKPIADAELFRVMDGVLAGRPAAEPEPPVRGRPEALLDPAARWRPAATIRRCYAS
jgi:hypothetical protein